MAKEKIPNKRELEIARNIEILKKYYDVDETKKVVNVRLHYCDPTEILNTNVSTKEKPIFKRDFVEEMKSYIDTFPVEYNLGVDFTFDDYGEYDHETLLTAFLDMMELEHYVCSRFNKRAWLIAILLAIIGSAMIIALFFLEDMNCLTDDLLGRTIDYVIDTWACIFIWEALSMLLLYPNETLTRDKIVLSRFEAVSFSDSKKGLLIKKEKEEFEANWVVRTKKQSKGDIMLFISGSALIIAGLAAILNNISSLIRSTASLSRWETILAFTFILLFGAIQLTAGIAAICRGFEKGKIGKAVPFFGFFMGAISVAVVILLFTFKAQNINLSPSVLSSSITGIILSVLYIVGDIFVRTDKKKKSKK